MYIYIYIYTYINVYIYIFIHKHRYQTSKVALSCAATIMAMQISLRGRSLHIIKYVCVCLFGVSV